MRVLEIEVSEDLAKDLRRHADDLPMLLELGLQEWLRRRQGDQEPSREQILRALAASDQVKLPEPYEAERPYVRQTPVQVKGRPVSEVVLEQRGPR